MSAWNEHLSSSDGSLPKPTHWIRHCSRVSLKVFQDIFKRCIPVAKTGANTIQHRSLTYTVSYSSLFYNLYHSPDEVQMESVTSLDDFISCDSLCENFSQSNDFKVCRFYNFIIQPASVLKWPVGNVQFELHSLTQPVSSVTVWVQRDYTSDFKKPAIPNWKIDFHHQSGD